MEKLEKAISSGVISNEKRLLYAIVFEADTFDIQGDKISAETIENSAHDFLIDYGFVGLDHVEPLHAKVVESFIAPVDFTYEGSKTKVKKGSWVVVIKVFNDSVWEKIKAGGVRGVSAGGSIVEYEKIGVMP